MAHKKILYIALSVLLLTTFAAGENRHTTASRVRHDAAITYTSRYQVKCGAEVVQGALKHPALMGGLWDVYGYAPAYKIKKLAEVGAVHVIDPTGIVGDLWLLKQQKNSWLYLAQGKIDHWAVPGFNGGSAVFELQRVEKNEFTQVQVEVFIEPESRIASVVLQLLEPIIIKHIDNRVSLNFQDAARLMETIDQTPEKIIAKLEGALLQEFKQVFK